MNERMNSMVLNGMALQHNYCPYHSALRSILQWGCRIAFIIIISDFRACDKINYIYSHLKPQNVCKNSLKSFFVKLVLSLNQLQVKPILFLIQTTANVDGTKLQFVP